MIVAFCGSTSTDAGRPRTLMGKPTAELACESINWVLVRIDLKHSIMVVHLPDSVLAAHSMPAVSNDYHWQ